MLLKDIKCKVCGYEYYVHGNQELERCKQIFEMWQAQYKQNS